MSPDPFVFRRNVRLTPPDIQDKTADAERLRDEMGNMGVPALTIPLNILRRLPEALRQNQFNLDLVIGFYENTFRVLDLEKERNLLFLAEYEFKNDNTTIKLGTSFRNIENKIYYFNILNKFLNAEGFTGTLLNSYVTYEQRLYKHFVMNMMMMNHYQLEDGLNKYPPLMLKLSMYYELESGRSNLRIGVSGKYLTSFSGETFLPQYRGYMAYEDENEAMFDGLKVYALAKLGNAYVKASFENLLGSGYYTVPIYPYYNRNFRLSFIWSFLD